MKEILKKLQLTLNKLPKIGEKTAINIASFLIEQKHISQELIDTLNLAISNIEECPHCHMLKNKDRLCEFCNYPEKNTSHTLYIVETVEDGLKLSEIGINDLNLHVLKNFISPIKGVFIENTTIPELTERVKQESITEIIFCFNPKPIEAQATILEIKQLLKNNDIVFSILPQGLPTGVSIEFVSNEVLKEAITTRQRI